MNRLPRRMIALLASLVLVAFTSRADVAAGVHLPPFERATLANGTQVLLMEKHDTPLVALSAVIPGGALGDPAGKDGTASLYADLIQKGAGGRDAAQFAEAIESVGGALTASADAESIELSASFMAKDVDLMLELAGDMLQRPRLAADEFAKVQSLAVQSIAAAKDSDPRALIGEYGDAWLFHGHPYGRPVGGSEGTLGGISLTDVKEYGAAQVGGDRLILAVVGDFKAADMKRKLEAAFGGWRAGSAALPIAPPPVPLKGRKVLLVDKPGATQTYFWLGNVGASRTDPARTAQSVVNTVFGGRYTSMLNTELRIKSGLTYGASASFLRARQPASFSIRSYTQTEKTTEAIDLALATLDRLHHDGFDAATLDSSKRYMLGQFPPSIETNGQLADRLTDLAFYALGPDDVDQYATRVSAVDDAVARTTIRDNFPVSGDLAIVLVGDAAKIGDAVRKYGPVTRMSITDPAYYPAAAR
jgi:predicted Zn-dependent peptidase